MASKRGNKRWTTAVVAAGLLAAAPLGAPQEPARAQPQPPPNILIIMTDDQRADRDSMSMLPQTLERIADKGITFKNAIATTPRCCPSRASIFTGKYVHNHGIQTNEDGPSFDATDTMQRLLKDNGYATAIAGKYLNGVLDDPPHFDRFTTLEKTHNYFRTWMNVDGEIQIVTEYLTDFISDKAKEYLKSFEDQNDDQPWFMLVTPYAPHKPADPAPEYLGTSFPKFEDNRATKESNLKDKPIHVIDQQAEPDSVLRQRRKSLLSLKSVDDMVARLLRQLSKHDEAKNTLVMFMSDNGYLWLEHGLQGKKYPYDKNLRIPFLARWPGHVKRGRVSDKLVANIDVAPTVLEAAGIEPDYPIDGKSIFSSPARDNILIEWVADPNDGVPYWDGIWTPGFSYVEYNNGYKEYYDDADKWELLNLLGNKSQQDDPTNQPQLSLILQAYKACIGATCP